MSFNTQDQGQSDGLTFKVGEREFNAESAATKIQNADSHIGNLEAENAEFRNRVASLEAKLEQSTKLDDALASFKASKEEAENVQPVQNTTGLSEEQIAARAVAGVNHPAYSRTDKGGQPVTFLSGGDTVVSLVRDNVGHFREMVEGLFSKSRPKGTRKLVFPHKLLLFRPRMTYRMGTAILLKGGEELGQTLHGHHDFQLTDDVIHKTHIGHYTFYSKSVVREPKNMYLAEDVYCAGYNGGENTRFITEDNVVQQWSRTTDHSSRSIICIPVPVDTPIPACMSVVGDFETHQMNMRDDDDGRFATSGVLKEQLEQYMGPYENRNVDEEVDTVNGVCFHGATMTQQKRGGPFTMTQMNTGHWGPSVYDGCAAVRQGMYAHLRPPGDVRAISYS